jgi:hypothetical protein
VLVSGLDCRGMRQPALIRLGAVALVSLVVLFQWQLFRQHVTRKIAWAYPATFDQAAILAKSYEICETFKTEGLSAGLGLAMARDAATTTIFPLEGAVLCRIFGPSRLSALAVNFLHLAALEAILVATLAWLTGRFSLAFSGLGLLLAVNSPFTLFGGLTDFRMDTAAAALFGIFLCVAIRSRTFADRGWSCAAGAAAGVLLAVRTLTLAYFLGTLVCFAGWGLWRIYRGSPDAEAWRRRVVGTGAASLVFGTVAVPLAWIKWSAIHDYYVVGHLTGPDKWIHPKLLGIRTVGDFIFYYPRSFLADHAGASFLWAASALLATSALVYFFRGARPAASPDWAPAVLLSALALAVPLVTLTIDVAKSQIVASILVGPALWLVLLAATRLIGPPVPSRESAWTDRVLSVLALGLLALGLTSQWRNFHGPGPFSGRRETAVAVVGMYGAIGESSRVMGWSAPLITVDRLVEFLVPSLTTTEMYERRGILVKARFGLWKLGSVTAHQALASVAISDFVLLTTTAEPELFPFDVSMRELHPRLVEACALEHVRLRQVQIGGLDVTVYVRATLNIEAENADGREGGAFVLTGLRPVVAARPVVDLWGPTTPEKPIRVSAAIQVLGEAPRPVPALLDRADGGYHIRLDVPLDLLEEDAQAVRIRVQLDGSQLALPDEVRLRARVP